MTDAHSPAPEEVMAYVDGELTADAAREILTHLAACERCQRLIEDLREASRRTRAWQVDEVPTALRLPETSSGPSAPMHSRVWRMARTRTLAAAALVLIAGTFALNSIADKPWSRAKSSAEMNAAQEAAMSLLSAERKPAPAIAERLETRPLIVRTVTLRMAASNFDAVRPAIDRALRDTDGFVGQLGASEAGDAGRSIRGTLRVPAGRLDEVIAALKKLGRVVDESQQSDDVTDQIVDLDTRIANGKMTEKRLAELIQNRSGRVSDVLEVEREMARVRTELERLEAQRKNAGHRVAYATLNIEVLEERRAGVSLGPVPVTARLRDAISDGFESALSSLLELTLFLLRIGPALLLWTILACAAAWPIVRRLRPRRAAG